MCCVLIIFMDLHNIFYELYNVGLMVKNTFNQSNGNKQILIHINSTKCECDFVNARFWWEIENKGKEKWEVKDRSVAFMS